MNYSGFSNAPSFQYTYNADGTIASDGESNDIPRYYSYDKLGQLTFVSDDNNDLRYTYNYDSAGNIKSVSVQGVYHDWEDYNNTYTYGNTSWADLLTTFNGQNIAYEGQSFNSSTGAVTGTVQSGNPISYYNGSRWTFSWQNGRQLTSASKSGTSISYTYDLNSLRTSKTVNGVQHNYVYASGKLLRETYGNTILDFSYGLNGAPYSLTYTNGSDSPVTYYYITNLQNDVMYLVDANGTNVAEYKYDPFGKVITATGSMGEINPIRYRGYYYDSETGFYYLQARYYDPTICRFINADFAEYSSTSVLGDCNLFAYCGNSTTLNDDQNGEFWHIIVGAVIGAVVGAVSAAVQGKGVEGIVAGAVFGAAGGALAASGAGVVIQAIGGGLLGMAENAVNQVVEIAKDDTHTKKFNVGSMLLDGAIGVACGIAGGNGASYGNAKSINQAGKQLLRRGLFNPQARSYYAKVAHNAAKEYVFKPLLKSLNFGLCGRIVSAIFN